MASTILLSDNGASSGSAGLKQTAGNDGVLILQTTTSGGTATNAIYIDTTQNVMVNTTSNAGYWSKSVTLNGSSGSTADAGMDFIGYRAGDGDVGGVGFLNAASSNARIAGIFGERSGANNSGALTFYTMNAGSAAERVKILSTGGTQFNYGISVGGTAPASEGSGVKFPATQVASSDANTLDDYEEGTWTPTLSGSSTNPTVTYHANNGGRYIKIGKMVYLQCYLRWTALTGGSVVALVGGLPFTTASTAQAIGLSGVTEWSGSFPTNATYPTPSLESGPGTTYLYILRNGPGTSSINMAISSLANADTYLLFGFCYEAAA